MRHHKHGRTVATARRANPTRQGIWRHVHPPAGVHQRARGHIQDAELQVSGDAVSIRRLSHGAHVPNDGGRQGRHGARPMCRARRKIKLVVGQYAITHQHSCRHMMSLHQQPWRTARARSPTSPALLVGDVHLGHTFRQADR